MRKSLTLLLMTPLLAVADVWRPSSFEIKGWNSVVPAAESHDNVFSPIGLAISVAMLGEGTGGGHRANISDALGLLSDFGNAFSYVFKSYAAASASNLVSITIAPSIWSRRHKMLDIEYRHSLQRNFEAETGDLVNALPINAWTEAKTDGRITEIVEKINPRTEILLLNAIAFEGAWKTGFDEADTVPSDFIREDGKCVKLPMMHGEADVIRVATDDYTALRLPFSAPGLSMIYLLPKKGKTVAAFRGDIGDKISIDELKTLFRSASGVGVESSKVKLAIPRMEISSRWNAMPALSTFKVPVEGYPRIGPDFKINEVRQATYIKIVETGYSLTPGATPPPPPKKRRGRNYDEDEDDRPKSAPRESFVLDRPFIYFVWDENSDTLLIAGQFMGGQS